MSPSIELEQVSKISSSGLVLKHLTHVKMAANDCTARMQKKKNIEN